VNVRRLHTGEIVDQVLRHAQVSASSSVVIGVVGDDVFATPQGCKDERRKTSDGAERASTAAGKLQAMRAFVPTFYTNYAINTLKKLS
jgi:hypothetical protein